MVLSLSELGWDSHFAVALDALPAEPDVQARREGELSAWVPARVMSVHRGHIDIKTEQGDDTVPMALLAQDAQVTVGDWILLDKDGRVRHVLPRKTEFKRRAAGTGREWQLIAANVDVLFIVTSCNQEFNIARLERYLVLAEEAGAWPVIVLTKIDLCDDADRYRQDAESIRPGLMVEAVNALDPESVDRLASWCGPGQTVALLGSSGVGKSTLVNTLKGDHSIVTGGIREDDDKGRHTTTARAMHRLANGGWLLDTPGMRELQIADVHDGIEQVFDDIATLATQCRFSDCHHESEPGCTIQAAIRQGTLDTERFRRYQKLQREDARNSETLADRHERERQFGRMVKVAKSEKMRR